ncbi:alpha/beta fold hydrolase [Candidatus Saccharibacteria bacterium]|nr:alpha/beta fold hydrolase [Candidatus Saccharibacteria bacterium]MBR6961154.1 alpha/beta fold hydrolase [Candidatus Saccharibacteria bacterium]
MLDWFIHRVLKIPLTMRVRYDHCAVENPELTIVFIHGIAASFAAWKNTIPELSKDRDLSKVRFIAFDLIGFGKSEKPKWFDYDYAAYRKTITRTLKKLKINTPLIICGHSMGCLIAMDYAANGDLLVDQLVLISPPIIRAKEVAGVQDQVYSRLYTGLKNHTGAKPIGVLAGLVDSMSSFEKRSLDTQAFRETMDKIILNKDNYALACDLKIPMEVIHGRLDPLVIGANLKSIAKNNKRFRLTETFGGHDIVGAKATKSNKILKETLIHYLLHVDL